MIVFQLIHYANDISLSIVLALVIVPAVSVAVRKFGRFLRELSHKTQAAAAGAASIAEVCLHHSTAQVLFLGQV